MASNRPKAKPTKRKSDGAESTRYGRPTTYREEYCAQLIKHMADGFSFWSFAADIDSDENTILGWTEAHEDFSRARTVGTAKRRKWYEQMGQRIMAGQLQRIDEEEYARDADGKVIFDNGKPVVARRKYAPARGDSKPWTLTMKNAFGFTDTLTVKLKGAGAKKDPAEMTEDELDEELDDLRRS